MEFACTATAIRRSLRSLAFRLALTGLDRADGANPDDAALRRRILKHEQHVERIAVVGSWSPE